ncbi:hypothetical protein [Metabacillus indicus]|uniref:Lipoprotein n=1 Tax=Metabacillus indicus TaxID=246786 RepID=A0A084GNP5_METID|nr:hypothetical protein [Metabacillus indicus]KEZ48957.1 hypothetical protein GS18_0216200 [Metabacillus indicus]
MRYFYITLFILFAAGCSEEKVPDTEAFKDEFTREFIKEGGETEDGYYTFESKTKGYTMLFPEHAKVSERDFESHEDKYETLSLGEKMKNQNTSYYIKLTYEKAPNISDIDVHLEQLTITSGYKGDFKREEFNNNIVYSARESNEQKGLFYYIAVIKAKDTDQIIRLTFDSSCSNGETECNVNPNELNQRLTNIVHSIQFK